MKHLRNFPDVETRDEVLATIDYNILQCTEGVGVGIAKGTYLDYSEPFYVENITNSNETLLIKSYNRGEEDDYLEITVQYSTDRINWNTLGTTGSTALEMTLQPNDKVYLRANTNTWYEYQEEPFVYHGCNINGVSKIGGNIMSLLYGSNFTGNERSFPSGTNYNFYGLFSVDGVDGDNTVLVSASELLLPATALAAGCYDCMFACCKSLTSSPTLPATTLANNCYSGMFVGCTSLTSAPTLPATTLAAGCYISMFAGCASLTSAPALPATTLADHCYASMFNGCASLTSAPALPATTLANNCYASMFIGCASLTSAPALPATTLANNCYASMFIGCASLTSAPTLPATTLADHCYEYMFSDCTSLTPAPTLPATTLANNCYDYMFAGCASLTSAPTLPATTLANNCYSGMFCECTSLTSAPTLPATTLADHCYEYMFSGCTKLNYIKCIATNISASECTKNWVRNVASTGTFVKNASTTWTTGTSGIPDGWTVEEV